MQPRRSLHRIEVKTPFNLQISSGNISHL